MSSSGIDYTIVMDAETVRADLEAAGESFPRYLHMWLVSSANLVREEVERRAPVGVAGSAGQGLSNNIEIIYEPDGAGAIIQPNSNVSSYAAAVENGSRPHRPPAGPDSSLAQWCEMKGISVWAVATSIARKGTTPHPYFQPAYEATKEAVKATFTEGVSAYIARYA